MYSPPRSEGQFKGARDRLLEDMRFTSKMVCPYSFLTPFRGSDLVDTKITNVCITLNEFPYIRYYMPTNHQPLGPLKPHNTIRPPPPENTSRWRTNLARGSEARAYEAVESEFVTKVLAFMVQSDLDEYKKTNPDFGVCSTVLVGGCGLDTNLGVHYMVFHWYKKGDMSKGRATLIITDRTMDMIAPFVHEFTYQAMANDLLPIENGTKFAYVNDVLQIFVLKQIFS